MKAKSFSWILVTGQPGCGKTTAVKKMAELLQSNGVKCKGFYTEEVRDSSGSRVGFDVVTIPEGRRGILARKDGSIRTKFKTGPYFVDVKSFEDLALPSLSMEGIDMASTVFVLDEIGRMELHSKKFSNHVLTMLEKENIHLVGAITAPRYGHRVPFCDEVAAVEGVEVHNLTKKTRDSVMLSLIEALQSRWSVTTTT